MTPPAERFSFTPSHGRGLALSEKIKRAASSLKIFFWSRFLLRQSTARLSENTPSPTDAPGRMPGYLQRLLAMVGYAFIRSGRRVIPRATLKRCCGREGFFRFPGDPPALPREFVSRGYFA